jgi:hypothetical protein
MNAETRDTAKANLNGQPWQVHVMAAVCLLVGVLVGYLVRGSAAPASFASVSRQSQFSPTAPPQMPSLEDMKRMADQQPAPLLARLKTDPNDTDLLNQIDSIYRATHQFDTAAS